MAKDPSKNIPNSRSPAEAWIQWHRDLKRTFGRRQANSIWVYAWSKRGGINSPANTRNLRNYMSGEGVDVSRTSLSGVGDSLSNFGSGIFSFFKWGLIIPIAVGSIAVLIIVYNISKDKQTVNKIIDSNPKLKGMSKTKGLIK